jgi:hypothetical protein
MCTTWRLPVGFLHTVCVCIIAKIRTSQFVTSAAFNDSKPSLLCTCVHVYACLSVGLDSLMGEKCVFSKSCNSVKKNRRKILKKAFCRENVILCGTNIAFVKKKFFCWVTGCQKYVILIKKNSVSLLGHSTKNWENSLKLLIAC